MQKLICTSDHLRKYTELMEGSHKPWLSKHPYHLIVIITIHSFASLAKFTTLESHWNDFIVRGKIFETLYIYMDVKYFSLSRMKPYQCCEFGHLPTLHLVTRHIFFRNKWVRNYTSFSWYIWVDIIHIPYLCCDVVIL